MQASLETLLLALVLTAVLDGAVLLLWLVLAGWGRHVRLRALIESRDTYPSLAKFQFIAWTAVVLPVFTWVYLVRLLSGVTLPLGSIPANILALMGISVASVPIAEKLSPDKSPGKGPDGQPQLPPLRTMLEDVGASGRKPGFPVSLANFQMFMWTFISIVIYLAVVYLVITAPATLAAVETLTLPDVDPALVVLMGLSQTGFIGAKAIR